MTKRIAMLVLCLCVCLAVFTGCCQHETWNEADCVTPKTCAECEETEGEPLGHTWVDADCVNPKTCSACGETEGDVLDHTWADADCVNPKTCTVCGETEGEALGHTWTDATCDTAKTCTVCGETEGEALGHSFGDWVELDAENEEHTCTVCNYTEQQTIDRKAKLMTLLEGDWELAGFCIEDGVYPLSDFTNAADFDSDLHFGNDVNVKLTYVQGGEANFVINFDSYFDYEVTENFIQYSFIMEDELYYYTSILFIFTDGSVQLWTQLDQDFWIFTPIA